MSKRLASWLQENYEAWLRNDGDNKFPSKRRAALARALEADVCLANTPPYGAVSFDVWRDKLARHLAEGHGASDSVMKLLRVTAKKFIAAVVEHERAREDEQRRKDRAEKAARQAARVALYQDI